MIRNRLLAALAAGAFAAGAAFTVHVSMHPATSAAGQRIVPIVSTPTGQPASPSTGSTAVTSPPVIAAPAPNGVEPQEPGEAPETAEAAEPSGAPEASDPTEASDVTETSEAPEAGATPEPADATDTSDGGS